MYKVMNIQTGEIFTVYGVGMNGMLLFFRPPEPGELPVWIYDDMTLYEPVEDEK